MSSTVTFGEALEVADQLSLEDQRALIDILHRRLAQAGRLRVIAEVQESCQDFAEGRFRTVTPDELMREILG